MTKLITKEEDSTFKAIIHTYHNKSMLIVCMDRQYNHVFILLAIPPRKSFTFSTTSTLFFNIFYF